MEMIRETLQAWAGEAPGWQLWPMLALAALGKLYGAWRLFQAACWCCGGMLPKAAEDHAAVKAALEAMKGGKATRTLSTLADPAGAGLPLVPVVLLSTPDAQVTIERDLDRKKKGRLVLVHAKGIDATPLLTEDELETCRLAAWDEVERQKQAAEKAKEDRERKGKLDAEAGRLKARQELADMLAGKTDPVPAAALAAAAPLPACPCGPACNCSACDCGRADCASGKRGRAAAAQERPSRRP